MAFSQLKNSVIPSNSKIYYPFGHKFKVILTTNVSESSNYWAILAKNHSFVNRFDKSIFDEIIDKLNMGHKWFVDQIVIQKRLDFD